MGVAERKKSANNSVFTNVSAVVVLRDAIEAARKLDLTPDPLWAEIADNMAFPMRGSVMVSHDGYRATEEKGATPDPLMAIFPLGFPLGDDVQAATLDFYLARTEQYLGSPMLSALYGVWAAARGDRRGAARLLEDGYGRFCVGRFMQTLEYRADVFPEQPQAGPFFANIGGFVTSLLMGFTGLRPNAKDPASWAERKVVLPDQWKAIEVDQLRVHGRLAKLQALHGSERAVLSFVSGRKEG
jgi:hypothetical protein